VQAERVTNVGSKHSGATLVEVLVAIFVMAIGLITLLTLFPLGLLSMSQAIKDDRCAHTVANAAAIERIWDIRHAGYQPLGQPAGTNPTGSYWTSTGGLFVTPTIGGLTSPLTSGPGYPIYVDPFAFLGDIGSSTPNPSYGSTLGALTPPPPTGPGIQRVDIGSNDIAMGGVAGSTGWRVRWFALLDDIEFENNGVPAPGNPANPGGNNIFREDRYTWAYLFRMPDVTNPAGIEVTVVVYSGRTQLSGEQTYQARWKPSATGNVVRVYYAATDNRPAIRKGGWILEPTIVGTGSSAPNTNGYFYRVVNVSDVASELPGFNAIDLELLTNRRGATYGIDPGLGVVVIMEGVVEVFERGAS
jgi:hypothetical protein